MGGGGRETECYLSPAIANTPAQKFSILKKWFQKHVLTGAPASPAVACCFLIAVACNAVKWQLLGLEYSRLESAPVHFLCLEILSGCWSLSWKKICTYFSPRVSRNLVTFSSCPQALEKELEMWQDFGLWVRNVLLACENPPSKFCQVICLWREKSSHSWALTKSRQIKKK